MLSVHWVYPWRLASVLSLPTLAFRRAGWCKRIVTFKRTFLVQKARKSTENLRRWPMHSRPLNNVHNSLQCPFKWSSTVTITLKLSAANWLSPALRSDPWKYCALVEVYAIYRPILRHHKLVAVSLANNCVNDLIFPNLANYLLCNKKNGLENWGRVSTPRKELYNGAFFLFSVSKTTENVFLKVLIMIVLTGYQ